MFSKSIKKLKFENFISPREKQISNKRKYRDTKIFYNLLDKKKLISVADLNDNH